YLIDLGVAHKVCGRLSQAADPDDLAAAEREYAAALGSIRRAIALDAKNASAWTQLMFLFCDELGGLRKKQGREQEQAAAYKDALHAAEKAAALTPQDPTASNNLSLTHQK